MLWMLLGQHDLRALPFPHRQVMANPSHLRQLLLLLSLLVLKDLKVLECKHGF
jgi:hypothetical protein